MLCAHAENHGIISWMVKRLLARGYTQPKYHAISHARFSEAGFRQLILVLLSLSGVVLLAASVPRLFMH